MIKLVGSCGIKKKSLTQGRKTKLTAFLTTVKFFIGKYFFGIRGPFDR
jgi:hypothetical protein